MPASMASDSICCKAEKAPKRHCCHKVRHLAEQSLRYREQEIEDISIKALR